MYLYRSGVCLMPKKRRNKQVVEKAKARDGRCVGCGRVEGLDAHHIEGWGAHLEDDPDNMVTLCRTCHTKWHMGDETIRLRVENHMKRVVVPDWVARSPGINWDTLLSSFFPAQEIQGE